jgi:hypothetical protein
VFENRVLRRTFGPKRVEVTGGWRELHNEELHNVCSSTTPWPESAIELYRRSEVGRARSTNVGKRNAYNLLVRKKERRKENTKKTKT